MANVVRVVIPDSGVLISLAQGGLLDLLVVFHANVRIVITDVVEYEVTHRTDLDDANEIRSFLSRNQARLEVEATTFAELLGRIRKDPALKLPSDAGEMSVFSYVRTRTATPPGEPTLILFEDDWFLENDIRPGNVHLLSTRAFIKGLQRVAPEFPSASALRRILERRPTFQGALVDRPAGKIKGGTAWEPSVDPAAVKRARKKLR